MNNRKRNKSQLFLLEFTIVVLFFAICSAICVSTFVKADQLSKSNDAERKAMLQMQNAAEIIKAADYSNREAALKKIAGYLSAGEEQIQPDSASYVVYYDDDFKNLASDAMNNNGTKQNQIVNSKYTMNVEMSYSDDGMMTAKLRVFENKKVSEKKSNAVVDQYEISNLVVKKYLYVI